MPLDTQGFDGLASDIAGMASRMDADGAGAPVARRILEAAAHQDFGTIDQFLWN